MRLVHRIWASCSLFVYFMYELIVSSIRVAWDVLTPTSYARPGFISVPMDAKSDAELMLTANLISLTPGTLSVDLTRTTLTYWFMRCLAQRIPKAKCTP